jgi:hypothetical protein
MNKKSAFMFFIFFLITISMLLAQEDTRQTEESDKEQKDKSVLKIDMPFFDLPYQVDIIDSVDGYFPQSYGSLSMAQSLALTTDMYFAMHYGLKKMYDHLDFKPFWNKAIYYGTTAAGILAFAYILPYGYPWMKNEYIRTIPSRYGILTQNNTWSGFCGITDSQLSYLKENAPYDFIRMNAAGHEAYILFSDTLIRNFFYYNPNDLSWITALVATWIDMGVNSSPFIQYDIQNTTGTTLIDLEYYIEKRYKNDKAQETRALACFDMLNWGYELFHPDEPYAARGLHPSGDGSVARYITFEQFSDDEMKYLVKHSYLSLLNYVSPLLFGFRTIPLGNSGLEGNFALHHYLTSFGTDITASVFLKKKPFNMAFTYHSYQNYNNYFPAIEAELVDFPLTIGKLEMFLSPRLLIGMQPKDQVFKTDSPEFLGLFGLRADFKVNKNILPYFDFTVKTKGWVAGNEYLDTNVNVKLGVSLRF